MVNPDISSVRVSIGLPTYNRGALLRRAIESALRQSHSNLELVISDNASTDNTQATCEEYARNDDRVRYVRQPENIGMTLNFNAVLHNSTSDYFMWLSDDDWLDDRYLEHCLRELILHPDCAAVCGRSRFYLGAVHAFDGDMVQVTQDEPYERVLYMYRTVEAGGMFYGVIRRDKIGKGFPNKQVLWEDILLIASIMFQGKGETLDSVFLNRSHEGASSSRQSFLAHYGHKPTSDLGVRYIMGRNAAGDIRTNPVYNSLPSLRRMRLAAHVHVVVWLHYWRPTLRGQYLRFMAPIKRSFIGDVARSLRARREVRRGGRL